MVNYGKSKIYCIKSYQTDLVYYGSTTQLLCIRIAKHKDHCKRYVKGTKHYITSYEIIKFEDAYIELLENYPCNTKEELITRERHYIENNKCVNKTIPGRSVAEYYQDHKDRLLKYHAKYRKNNREQINQKQRTKFNCPCGGKYSKVNIASHTKSKKHQQNMMLLSFNQFRLGITNIINTIHNIPV